jgi:hypothetical protein
VLTVRVSREAREKGASEVRSQAKLTNSLRVREPRGLGFRCGPAPERHAGPFEPPQRDPTHQIKQP